MFKPILKSMNTEILEHLTVESSHATCMPRGRRCGRIGPRPRAGAPAQAMACFGALEAASDASPNLHMRCRVCLQSNNSS